MPGENAHLVDEATAIDTSTQDLCESANHSEHDTGLIPNSSSSRSFANSSTQYPETSAEEEFANIVAACVAYLGDDRKSSFESFVPSWKQYVLKTLKLLYKHKGYVSICDAVFFDMAGWYDAFRDTVHYHKHMGWRDCSYCHLDRDPTNILVSRDVPTAVTYMHKTTNSLVCIEQLAFCDLAEVATEYLAFTNDFDIWPDKKVTAFREFSGPVVEWLHYENGIERIEWTAFKDVAAAVTGYLSYEPPPYFPHFLQLPAELRKMVYHYYLREDGTVWPDPFYPHVDAWDCSSRLHCSSGWYRSPEWNCCRWKYPDSLTLCDKSEKTLFSNRQRAGHISSSLPAIAFTCGQLQGEIIVYILQHTQRVVLNFEASNKIYDGGAWFHDALAAIPYGDGLRAVKNLAIRLGDVSHLSQASLVPKSPMVQLAVACVFLREIELTVPTRELFSINCRTGMRTLRSVDTLIDLFALRPLLNCERLCRVHINCVDRYLITCYPRRGLDAIFSLGKWLMMGFLVQQERRVQVIVTDLHDGWPSETVVTLDEADEKEVDDWPKAKKAKASLKQTGAR